MRSPCTATKSNPSLLQPGKVHVQQRRPSTTKDKITTVHIKENLKKKIFCVTGPQSVTLCHGSPGKVIQSVTRQRSNFLTWCLRPAVSSSHPTFQSLFFLFPLGSKAPPTPDSRPPFPLHLSTLSSQAVLTSLSSCIDPHQGQAKSSPSPKLQWHSIN